MSKLKLQDVPLWLLLNNSVIVNAGDLVSKSMLIYVQFCYSLFDISIEPVKVHFFSSYGEKKSKHLGQYRIQSKLVFLREYLLLLPN